MALKRKIRQIGNSLAMQLPNELFDFFDINPEKTKYMLSQDESGRVYIVLLNENVIALEEKKFQKRGTSYLMIIPKTLCNLWNVGLGENQKRELEISYDTSPLKWNLKPV